MAISRSILQTFSGWLARLGHACRTPLPGAAVSVMLVSLGAATAPLAEPQPPGVYFAEPISGRKVTRYCVDLPVGDDDYRTFTIPTDCGSVSQLINAGSVYKGSIVDRRIWQKVEADCRYHAFLHRHPILGIEDYVSDYDFMNAQIADLPVDQECASGPESDCNPTATDAFGMLRHFPLAEPTAEPSAGDQDGHCGLKDGLFRGRLLVDAHGIRCVASGGEPSLRLIAVDFADINGDRFLDAILRFVPMGRGVVRSPLILPVTRTAPEGPFHVPDRRPPTMDPPGRP